MPPGHRVYPYLLRDLAVDRPNQVWCADLTYLPMARGFLYLVAIMDWYSRKVLSWGLSTTQDTVFCVHALLEAIERNGTPEVFNTDQGSQFTSTSWTGELIAHDIRISMDGKGRWIDNVFIERLWRSLKYECVYLQAFADFREARDGIGAWVSYYNEQRPHSVFDRADAGGGACRRPMPGPGGVGRRCWDRRISGGLPDARHGRCVSSALSGSEPATSVRLLGVNLDNRAVEESHRARGLAPPERPVLWICGRALRTGANPAGRVDSPCATPGRCTPPDHTFAPLAHELHSIDNTILIEKEKTKTVQSGSI